jgi:catalase
MKILKPKITDNSKSEDLAKNTVVSDGEFLTTNQGLRINDDHNSLKAGERGPTLLEDFQIREKITHFDHERILDRIVHSRGNVAQGFLGQIFDF